MTTHREGDVTLARDGSKWRVLAVERTIVRAEQIETGVVSHFEPGALRPYETHPGGRR